MGGEEARACPRSGRKEEAQESSTPSGYLTRKHPLTRGRFGKNVQVCVVCGLGCTVLYAVRTLLSMFVPPSNLAPLSVPHNFTLL